VPSPQKSDALAPISGPSRVAQPDEGVGLDELGLAARNHGMPLEAMRYDVTPLGLHYVLTHYDIPAADADTWRLTVGGAVRDPVELSLADLRAMPARTAAVTLECAGNGRAGMGPRPVSQPWLHEAVGTMEWTGTPLRPLLEAAGVEERAVDVVFTGADHGVERGVEQDYARALPLADAMRDDVMLVYAANGAPLLPQHGYPLRLVVPGWYGMAHVKWLRSVELVDHEFDGFQHHAYRLREHADDPGVALTRIEPRALVVPPGWPDFMSRSRFLHAGQVPLAGRAWSGWGEVSRVEVTTDGGRTWDDALVEPAAAPNAWQGWRFNWTAGAGEYVVAARATDATGRSQGDRAAWNRGGFAGSTTQSVRVLVIP
jgi:DMSO/TMAO reductase YedYZ molybdopterin-dependent catalytic subunit